MKSTLMGAIVTLLLLSVACIPSGKQSADSKSQEQAGLIHLASQRVVSPPIEGLNVALQHFEIQADQSKTIDLPNGTQIFIPEGVLVDEAGKALTGTVDLTYREFHDAIDVFMSGIPMTYEAEDGTKVFQTAGMLEINATQNGNPVFIAEGKTIDIQMASFVEPPENTEVLEDDYQLYYLNQSTGLWEDRGENDPTPNPRKINTPEQPSVLSEKPMKPKKPVADEVVFDFAVDYKHYPQLAPYDGISWQYANVKTEEPGMINPNEEKWIFGQVWTDARVVEQDAKKGLYVLQIRNKTRKAQMIVTPVLEGKKYDNAMKTYEKINRQFEATREKVRTEQQRLSQQANMVRAFSISQFGTYNCDRFYSIPDAQMVVADFSFPVDADADDNQFVEIDRVFHLIPDSRAVITYTKDMGSGSWGQMNFSKSERNYLLAMLPGNEIAMFGPQDFAAADFGKEHLFELKSTGRKISSAQELREMISM